MHKEILEEIENFLRRHEEKITGAELQPALNLLEEIFMRSHTDLNDEQKKTFHDFFERMGFNDAGRSKYTALAYLYPAVFMYEQGQEKLVAELLDWAKQLAQEITRIKWHNHEIMMSALNRIKNSSTDALNLYNPKLTDIYEYEINAGRMTQDEKNRLTEFIKKIKAKT